MNRLSSSKQRRRFKTLNELADLVSELANKSSSEEEENEDITKVKDSHVRTLEEERVRDGESWFDAIDVNSADALLNLTYAPRGSKLYEIASVLSRLENFSHIAAWTSLKRCNEVKPGECPDVEFVELPRLKLAFKEHKDHKGLPQLYSLDHADLYICNEASTQIDDLLRGLPHSLVMRNTQGEKFILVSTAKLVRPRIMSSPFTTRLVLDRNDTMWTDMMGTGYYVYPVHVSLSFMITTGLNSALYLLLARFLARDYVAVTGLTESVATDVAFSDEERTVLHALDCASEDKHPDAHACRLRISLVLSGSGVRVPWNVTHEMAGYITKLSHVSASCKLTLKEENQILSSNMVVLDEWSPKWDPKLYTHYEVTLLRNRMNVVMVWMSDLTGKSTKSREVKLDVPPRVADSAWPYYQDNTLFGKQYAKSHDIGDFDDFVHVARDRSLFQSEKMLVLFFSASWSNACNRISQSVSELAAANPGVVFMTLKADAEPLKDVLHLFKVHELPYFVFLRLRKNKEDEDSKKEEEKDKKQMCLDLLQDAKMINKFSGESKGKIGRVLVNNLRDSDKVQVEDVKESDKDALARAARSWYWDVSNCGPTMKIFSDGITVCLKEEKDENKSAIWEYKFPTGKNAKKWQTFEQYEAAKMEECELRSLWKSGQQTFTCNHGNLTVYINGSVQQNAGNGEVYDSRGTRYGTIRRRLPGEKVHDEPDSELNQEDEEEKKRLEEEKAKAKKPVVLDNIEVVRGTSVLFFVSRSIIYIYTCIYKSKNRCRRI